MNVAASLQGLPDLAANPRVQRGTHWLLQRLPAIATAFAVLLITWQLAKLTWLLLPTVTELPLPPINIPPPQSAGAQIDVQKIADAHLFGVAKAENDPSDIANAQPTNIPLVLAGVLASPEPTKGFAFIGESAAAAKFVRVGQSVTGGVVLHSVYLDRVMLDRGGRLESLMLPRFTGGTQVQRAALPSSPQPTRFAENVRRLAETNPSAFSEIVRPQAIFAGGVQKGYRVYPGRNRQQFTKLGLQPGDLVVAVNGTTLTDPASAGQIFNTISTMDQVTLTVERGGKTQQLNINTAQIDLPDPGMPPQDPNLSGGPGTGQPITQ